MNNSFSSNASFETATEKFTRDKIISMFISIDEKLNKLSDDILDVKTIQEGNTEKLNREFIEKKNDINYLNLESEAINKTINAMTSTIKNNKDIISRLSPMKISINKDINDIVNNKYNWTSMKEEIMKEYNNRNNQISSLQYSNELLSLMNQRIKDEIDIKENEMNKELICSNCKMKYRQNNNNNNSCVYHPGEIKYYSCKGCGCDEYFTCCMKCEKCSKGCMKGKHYTRGVN